MDMKFTQKQAMEAIKHWRSVLESMNIAENKDSEEVKEPQNQSKDTSKKSLKQRVKEAIEPITATAQLAQTASTCASYIPESMQLARELILAINRGSDLMQKILDRQEGK